MITADIICHGVPSPLVWEKYFREICGDKIPKKVNFRDKSESWRNFSLAIDFDKDDDRYCKVASEDLFMRGFLNNLFLRESCYNCIHKGIERQSDITLGDYWGIENIKKRPDFDGGISAVIVHSLKGKQICEKLFQDTYYDYTSVSEIINYNSAMVSSVQKNERREEFFKKLSMGNQSIVRLLREIYEPSFFLRIKRKVAQKLHRYRESMR